MTAPTLVSTGPNRPPTAVAWLTLVTVWHGVLAAGGLIALALLWSSRAPLGDGWQRWVASVALVLFGAAAATAVPLLHRRAHRGRVIGLVVNYLGLIVALLYTLHSFGFFTGIDALANTFGRGVLFLLIVFAGYLIGALGDRYEGTARERQFKQAGKIVAAVGFVIFLWRIDTLGGLLFWLRQYTSLFPFALTLLVVLFGAAAWLLWRRPAAQLFHATNSHDEMLNGWLFLSPNLIGFLLFFAGPLLFSFYVSFTNWDAFGTQDWVGLANYSKILNFDLEPLASPDQRSSEVLDVTVYDEVTRFSLFGQSYVLGAADKLFWIALGNTLRFALMAVPLSVIPALFLANLLNSKIPGMAFFRAVYFLPSVAAVVGIALVWQWLFNATIGYVNYAITTVVNLYGGADPQIRWLSSSNTALLAVVIMTAWQLVGYNTVLFLAGLQNIPGELYEAATVDGAGSWARFWRITLPLLGPTTFFVLTTTIIRAMQVFDEVFILIPTNPAGPGNSTLTLVIYLYQKGFQRFEQGYASAIAWVLFILIFGVTLLQFQRRRASGGMAA